MPLLPADVAMSVELTTEQIKTLLQGITIPPQPQIMVDLQMEQLNPRCSMERIAKLISQDVGLAGSMLKTVNSPIFGLKNKIASIEQAIRLLGIGSVVNIINALSIRGSLTDEAIVALGRFWDSAMDIASTCSNIAKQIGYRAPDEAYTLGLFHNCGIPLLMQRFDNYPEIMKQAYTEQQRRVIDIENDLLETNHAVVGYYVAKSWNLPRHICEAIAEHHSAEMVFDDNDTSHNERKNLIAILKMAEHICRNYLALGDAAEDYEWQRIERNLLEYVGLSSYDFQNMLESMQEMGVGSGSYIHVR